MNKEKKVEHSSDRLSSLPDSILTEILSKLKATQLIQTCVLSKRWLKLWTFVPSLDFSDFKFKRKYSPETKRLKRAEASETERFEHFVSTVLRLRDDATDLHTFQVLQTSDDTITEISPTVAATWVRYALSHNPKKLEVVLCVHGLFHMPDGIFTCESLEHIDVDLEMNTFDWQGKMVIKPDTVRLPRLKSFFFGWGHFDGDSMERILNGCPVLENVGFSACALEMSSVSFRNLKDLSIINCCFVSEGFSSAYYCISAPGLRSVYFKGDSGTRIKLEDMSAVTNAEVAVIYDETNEYTLELLSGLSAVENLKIDSCLLEYTLEGELPKCPTFHNLKKLTIDDGCMYCHFGVLSSFLKHCPNLEILTLVHEHDYDEYDLMQEDWIQSMDRTESFGCSHLQKINIIYSKSDIHVDHFMRVLLKSTSEIDDLQIILSKNN